MSKISTATRRFPRWRWSLALFSGVLTLAAVKSDLGAGHRMIAPDLLGFGYSDTPADYPYGIAKHADMTTGPYRLREDRRNPCSS